MVFMMQIFLPVYFPCTDKSALSHYLKRNCWAHQTDLLCRENAIVFGGKKADRGILQSPREVYASSRWADMKNINRASPGSWMHPEAGSIQVYTQESLKWG